MVKSDYAQFGKHFDTRNGDNLSCRCCGKVIINPAVIRHYLMMDEFREWFNRPMGINSGCRCAKYNASLEGSATSSQHLNGVACDVAFPEEFGSMSAARKREFLLNIRIKWFELCDKYGVHGGFGIYNTFFHMDSRTEKRAQWDFSGYFK
jgi:hypothetical protein